MTIYRKMQQQLDSYSLGFPATDSGIEIDILKSLYTEEEAQLFLSITPKLESPESIAQRLDRDVESIAEKLEDMAARGLLFRARKGDAVRYAAIPFMHGIMEFQVNNFSQELAEKVERYLEENFYDTIAKSAELFIHPVPAQGTVTVAVNEPLNAERHVAAYDDAVEILKSRNLIVVADCICRKEKEVIGKGCGRPMETCFMFGSMAQYYLDNKLGRQVSVDEAIDIVTEAQKAGLVTQPATSLNPSGMCNCCGDCCGVLLSLKRQKEPASMVLSNHFVTVEEDLCTGCESCVEQCPMEALSMNEDIVQVDLTRCIGCGVCVLQCPTEALVLLRKDESQVRVPPQSSSEQFLTMAQKRGII